jgi:hypothetical protein
MKLGISYPVFHGFELLEYVLRPIRGLVDFVSVVGQEMSYHGNPASPDLRPTLERLEQVGLVDRLVFVEPDLTKFHKYNELAYRNLGVQMSREAGCTHHMSVDVDEFYVPEQLEWAKAAFGDHDCSVCLTETYYKHPTYRLVPRLKHISPFIQKIDVDYQIESKIRYGMEHTRRPSRFDKCLFYDPDKFIMHHMSYVRRDIGSKIRNNSNTVDLDCAQIQADFDKYQVGDLVRLSPDFMNRRTVLAPNLFNIPEEVIWGHPA